MKTAKDAVSPIKQARSWFESSHASKRKKEGAAMLSPERIQEIFDRVIELVYDNKVSAAPWRPGVREE